MVLKYFYSIFLWRWGKRETKLPLNVSQLELLKVSVTQCTKDTKLNMGIISLFSKLGPGLHDTLYFTAVTYPVTKELKSLQLGNTDFMVVNLKKRFFFLK